MNIRLARKVLIPFLALVTLFWGIGLGCQSEGEQLSSAPSSNQLSSMMVPDTNLDLYVYAKQKNRTTIPAKMVGMPHDVKVESLAIWGVPAGEGLVIGMELTFASDSVASDVYSRIDLEDNSWSMIRDSSIYVVRGSGAVAESLKQVISDNAFKYYNDRKVLEGVALLPRGGKTKLVAIAVARPTDELISFVAEDISVKYLDSISRILKLVKLDVVISGLYSPHQINIAKAAKLLETGSGISALDLGALVLIKSGLPGFVVEPVVENILVEQGFSKTSLDEYTIYKGLQDTPAGDAVPVLIRLEDNYIFASISGQQAYAETLITSIYK